MDNKITSLHSWRERIHKNSGPINCEACGRIRLRPWIRSLQVHRKQEEHTWACNSNSAPLSNNSLTTSVRPRLQAFIRGLLSLYKYRIRWEHCSRKENNEFLSSNICQIDLPIKSWRTTRIWYSCLSDQNVTANKCVIYMTQIIAFPANDQNSHTIAIHPFTPIKTNCTLTLSPTLTWSRIRMSAPLSNSSLAISGWVV